MFSIPLCQPGAFCGPDNFCSKAITSTTPSISTSFSSSSPSLSRTSSSQSSPPTSTPKDSTFKPPSPTPSSTCTASQVAKRLVTTGAYSPNVLSPVNRAADQAIFIVKVQQAAINQLAFGATPSAGAGGAGGACGVCYKITPTANDGTWYNSQALSFMIIDECPASSSLSGGYHCDQCSISATNDYGQHWHFDIAIDAMSTSQYNTFFSGVTDGINWKNVFFTRVDCDTGGVNPVPSIKSWGCITTNFQCSNNDAASVCANV